MELPAILNRGEAARLIPVIADTSKEQRVTSTVLSVLTAVEEFGHRALKAVGAPIGKTSKIRAFTEVGFSRQPKDARHRPDGLIEVRTGKRVWTALVEAKVGKVHLDVEQIEAYLDVARAVNADAVITISNQYAALPTHYPVSINRKKLGTVKLFHWSWGFLLTEAVLCEANKGIADPDQAFILREMIRYLDHDSSGVTSFDRMPASWKDLCANVQQGMRLTKSAPSVMEAVSAWHELTRYLALKMSVALGRQVTVHLSRAHTYGADRRAQDDVNTLVSRNVLTTEFAVPDAAGRIHFRADLRRKTLQTSMMLQAPKDKKRPSSMCTWIYRQVERCPDDRLFVVANWRARRPDTMATLGQLREDRNILIAQVDGQLPVGFEVRQVNDLGGRFRGARTFVEDAIQALPDFYEKAGQHLQAWVPKPPQMKREVDDGEKEEVQSAPRVLGGIESPKEPPGGISQPRPWASPISTDGIPVRDQAHAVEDKDSDSGEEASPVGGKESTAAPAIAPK